MKIFKNLKFSLICSIILHLGLLGLMVISFPHQIHKPILNNTQLTNKDIITPELNEKINSFEPKKIISAGLVSKKLVDNAIARQKHVENQKRLTAQQEQRRLLIAKQELQQLTSKAKEAKLQEQAAISKAQAAKAAEQSAKKLAQIAKDNLEKAKFQEQASKEKAKKELQAAKQMAEKELLVAKQQAKKELESAKAKAQAELTKAKELADAEFKKAKALSEKLEKEKIAAKQLWIEKEFSRFVAQIKEDILANRTLSAAFSQDLICKIEITLQPSGSISNVKILKSSGNQAYDYSSKAAVYKAAPFEMPENPDLNKRLRNIVLIFKCDDIG